jgi:hypothetical protein
VPGSQQLIKVAFAAKNHSAIWAESAGLSSAANERNGRSRRASRRTMAAELDSGHHPRGNQPR